MRWIVGWSLRSRYVVVAIAVGLIVLGIVQLPGIPVGALPEFGPPRVEVQTEALGLSAEEVEQLITVPLEQDLLNGVAFLDEIESASLPGLSSVVMTFQPGTDLLDARQVVQERLTQAHALPQVAEPPQMLQPLSSTSRLAMIRLSSDSLTPIEASVLARWVIVPRLLGVEGVANVSVWGFRDRQLQVLVDPQRLDEQGVSLNDVIRTTGNALEVSPLSFLEASQPGTGGWVDTVNQRLHVFHEQAITTPGELAQVPLELGDAAAAGSLTLGEIGEVREDHQPLIGDAHCQPGPCLLLVVERFPDANTPAVTEGIERALDAMRPGLNGLEIDTSLYRPAEYIDASLDTLAERLLIGGLLLLLVLLLLADWRRVVVAAVVVPLSLVVVELVLHLRGATLDMLVAVGLAAGLVAIVDDAVADAAELSRAQVESADMPVAALRWRAIVASAVRMRGAGLIAALIVVAALLPAFLTTGTAGAFLPPIALSHVLAIAASMVVALTVTPALALLLPARRARRGAPPAARRVGAGYARIAHGVMRRSFGIATLITLVVVGLLALPFLRTSLRPTLRERDVVVHLQGQPGTSLERMGEIVAEVVAEVVALPRVRGGAAHVGRAVTSDRVVDVNEAEVWIDLAPDADADTLAAVDGIADDIPAVSHELMTYSDQRIDALLAGASESLVVRVYGEDDTVLRDMTSQVHAAVAGVDGVDEARIDALPDQQAITVQVDIDRAQAHGVKPGDVRRQAAVLVSGITVGSLFEEQKVFDVVVWGDPAIRETEEDVRNLPIETPRGTFVPLGDVATVSTGAEPAAILHHSVMSFRDVVADVDGRSLAAAAADIEATVDALPFPLEYHAEVLDDFAEEADARARVSATAVASALAIFLLLQAAFASWRLATLGAVALLAAVSGGLVAVSLAGATVGLGSLIGLAALLGFAARSIILLVRHYRGLERAEPDGSVADLVLRGTQERVVPTVTSALAVAAVLGPFAVAGGAIGLELVQPVAVVVLAGLVTSVVTTLVVVPSLYLAYGFVSRPDTTTEDLLALPEVEPHRPLAGTTGP